MVIANPHPLHSEIAKAKHIHVSETLAGELRDLGLNFTLMTHRLCKPANCALGPDFLMCEPETQMCKNGLGDGLVGKALACKHEDVS